MKLNVEFGASFRKPLQGGRYLDITTFEKRWFTKITISLCEMNNPVTLKHSERKHFEWGKVLPLSIAERLGRKSLNKQCRDLIGEDLVKG